MTTEIEKRFEIRRTPEIVALCRKYESYKEDYILSDDVAVVFDVLPKLSEWEKVVLYAMTEYKTVRKFASFFGISTFKAHTTITDIKDKMKHLIRKEYGK